MISNNDISFSKIPDIKMELYINYQLDALIIIYS